MRHSSIVVGVLLLFAFSCNRTPTGLDCITVLYPVSGDVWDYMQGGTHVEWAGAEGDLVRMDIYKDGLCFVDYLGWIANSGSAVRTDYLHPACHGSGHYQIRIEDSNGNFGISDEFTIMCGGLGDIQITYPAGTPYWTFAGSDAYVTWTDSAGELVRVHVYRGDGTYIGILIDWTENDGFAEPLFPLDRLLVPGDYYIEIVDDLGRWGIGGDFRVRSCI